MESLIAAANIIKAALSNIFYINIESDESLNQQPKFQPLFQPIPKDGGSYKIKDWHTSSNKPFVH